jgi:hypothetical protein
VRAQVRATSQESENVRRRDGNKERQLLRIESFITHTSTSSWEKSQQLVAPRGADNATDFREHDKDARAFHKVSQVRPTPFDFLCKTGAATKRRANPDVSSLGVLIRTVPQQRFACSILRHETLDKQSSDSELRPRHSSGSDFRR